ncbi:hypothetical protein AVEN_131994-1 [Araneus ventricosus]|uniref:DUF5641 domain-containing protein n=1 Tax=Araneus ventricosus TaxID=182803 RepID=A0A4Y2B368_ARAVE|nr:hypothetical protein AVEN_131994-1 [Araneus ventricosus]
MCIATFYDSAPPPHAVKSVLFNNKSSRQSHLFSVSCFILPPVHKSEVVLHGIFPTVTPVVTKVLAAVRTLDRFDTSDRAGAAIVSTALQDVTFISESNVLNVVDRNKIRRGRTKARTTLLSQVIKDYDHNQFGLYFDGRKDRTLSIEDNRRIIIIEEHISLVKEPGSEYIGRVSRNATQQQGIRVQVLSLPPDDMMEERNQGSKELKSSGRAWKQISLPRLLPFDLLCHT